jgi:putative drug exporter of the RND superfamily
VLISLLRPVRVSRPREAVVTGYGQSGRVVTAAAVIMTGVFAAFLLDPNPVIKSIGLSLAFGVLVDAFVVRMTIVPAVMALLGRRAWMLPHRLDRIVPDVDRRPLGADRAAGAGAGTLCGDPSGPVANVYWSCRSFA